MTDPAVTHFPTPLKPEALLVPKERRKKQIAEKFREIFEILGLDLADPSLQQTPERMAEMYVEEIFSGLDLKNFPSIETQPFQGLTAQAIYIKNIVLTSFCEHHLVPMTGHATVAYLPKKHLIGLSKINRIVHYFAKRPQLQERLTAQIADSISLVLETEDVAVYTSIKHHCMASRGVKDNDCEVGVPVLRGLFLNDPTQRQEFFAFSSTCPCLCLCPKK